jgi:CRP/FNR family transcriptional regulator, cyclic AMP receptor protein
MTADELVRTSHPFLEGLSKEHITALASLAMPVSYSIGDTIFKEGDLADRFYLINDGTVSLQTSGNGEDKIEVQQLRSGEVLGWSWLFEPYSWQYDAVATAPTSAIFFYGTWLREQCEQNPALGYEIMKRIAEVVIARLQATRKSLERLRAA